MRLRIGRVLLAMVIGALVVVAPAAPARAATPELVVAGAELIHGHPWQTNLMVAGTVTCSEPSGQTEVSLGAIQVIGGIGSASGAVTVQCAAGPVYWETVLVGTGLHEGYLNVLGSSIRNGVTEATVIQPFFV